MTTKKKQSRTCIAAIRQKNGKIMLAADRRASWDWNQCQQMPRPKLAKRNGLILAATGDSYLCTLIVDILKFRKYEDDMTEDEYFHNIFYYDVLKLLKSKGLADIVSGTPILRIPKGLDVEVIIVLNKKLYTVVIENPIEQVEEHANSFGLINIDELSLPYATGCGGSLAWGSLLTTEDMDLKAKDRLTLALNIAAQVSPGCDNMIDIVSE